jgi:hypothetical protein
MASGRRVVSATGTPSARSSTQPMGLSRPASLNQASPPVGQMAGTKRKTHSTGEDDVVDLTSDSAFLARI